MASGMNQKKTGINVYPSALQFFADDVNTHRQAITIYNPFEKTIKFKVLTTAPKRYLVDEPEGFIKPKTFIELTIRHHISSFTDNTKDMLRIQIYQSLNANNQAASLIFKRDLPLDSVVSRAEFIMASNFREGQETSSLGEYSSTFAHGNNLNSMLGLNSNSSAKTRTLTENKKNLRREY